MPMIEGGMGGGADISNPKDLIGERKVKLNLLPAVTRIYGAAAMSDGAVKYGPYNWREKKVKMSVYLAAIERHLLCVMDGEQNAADSGVDHLGHIIANCGIILDARHAGCLIDDRPKVKGAAPEVMLMFNKINRRAKRIKGPLDGDPNHKRLKESHGVHSKAIRSSPRISFRARCRRAQDNDPDPG